MEKEIEALLEPYLEVGKFFLVDLKVKSSRLGAAVILLVDSDAGITIAECARISRRLGEDIENAGLFEESYNLEVSSPGLDQPLKLPRQFAKNQGRELTVVLKGGETLKGRLISLEGEKLTIELPKPKKKPKPNEAPFIPTKEVSIDEIEKATVEISMKRNKTEQADDDN